MKQSKFMSSLESAINIVVGLGVAMLANAIILPLVGFDVSLKQNSIIAAFMTVVSFGRSFALRRMFEALHIRNPISPSAAAVIAERRRQIEVEGWTAEHDDKHEPGELALAGASYAVVAAQRAVGDDVSEPPDIWTWDYLWWKPQDFRRDLIRAGALILAELDKHERSRKTRRTRQKIIDDASPVRELELGKGT